MLPGLSYHYIPRRLERTDLRCTSMLVMKSTMHAIECIVWNSSINELLRCQSMSTGGSHHRRSKSSNYHGKRSDSIPRRPGHLTNLVIVLHNNSLEFGSVDPCHEIFHVSVLLHESRVKTARRGERHRVTRYAGSVIVSGPTRTCPCSMNLTA